MQLDGLPLHVFQSVIARDLDKSDLHALRLASKSNKAYTQSFSDAFKHRMDNYVDGVAPSLRCRLALLPPVGAGSKRLGIVVPFDDTLALWIGLGCSDGLEIIHSTTCTDKERVPGCISPYLMYIMLAWSHGIVTNADPFDPTWRTPESHSKREISLEYVRDAVTHALQVDSQSVWEACAPLGMQFEGLQLKLSTWANSEPCKHRALSKAARTYVWKRNAVRLLAPADQTVSLAVSTGKRFVCMIGFDGRVAVLGRRVVAGLRRDGMRSVDTVFPLQLEWMLMDWARMCADRAMDLRMASRSLSSAVQARLRACKDALVAFRLALGAQIEGKGRTVDC